MAGKGPGVFEQELGEPRGQADADDRSPRPSHWAQGELDLAGHVRPRLLRDRDDVDRLVALRHRALRRRGLPLVAAPGRPADRLRPRRAQDGRAASPDLRPDARAEVGDRDGRLRELGRDVQQLRDPPGRRQDRRRRHPRAGLPAASGGARRGHRPPPGEDQGRRAARVRDPRGRERDVRRRPGLVERKEAYGETTLVVDPARARRGLHAPPRRGGLQLPVRHHGRRLPRLGRAARRRLHTGPPPGATSARRARRASHAGRTRSRRASRSTTTCWRSRARTSSASRSGSRTVRAWPAWSRSGRPPTGTSARPTT